MRLLLAAYSMHMPFPFVLDCLREAPVSEQTVYLELVMLQHVSAHGVWYIATLCMNNISSVYTWVVLVANFTGVLILLLIPPQWHQQWYSHCVYQAGCVALDIMPMLFEENSLHAFMYIIGGGAVWFTFAFDLPHGAQQLVIYSYGALLACTLHPI
jgi:hypothetical protein